MQLVNTIELLGLYNSITDSMAQHASLAHTAGAHLAAMPAAIHGTAMSLCSGVHPRLQHHHLHVTPAGGQLRGLYDPDSTTESILEDFLLFCKLAVMHSVVPPGWSWSKFLTAAAKLLPYAFEKSDAQEKWGGENVFAAAMGGRSLRYTGEVVYGSSTMGGGEQPQEARELHRQVMGHWGVLVSGSPEGEAVFADVGGVAAWRKLHSSLRLVR